jgi:hypothetical protein
VLLQTTSTNSKRITPPWTRIWNPQRIRGGSNVRIVEFFICFRNCFQKIYAFVHPMNPQCELKRISESTNTIFGSAADPWRIRGCSKFRIVRSFWRNNNKNGSSPHLQIRRTDFTDVSVCANNEHDFLIRGGSAADSNFVLYIHSEFFYILLHPMNPQCELKRIRGLFFSKGTHS